jgi:hypothetical protein
MRLPRLRYTIGRLMAGVAYAAVLLWLLRYADGVPFAVGLGGLTLAFASWAAVRGQRRPASICFVASVIAANGLVVPLCVYQQGWGWGGVYIGLLGGVPMILGFGTAWAVAAARPDTDQGRPPLASWHPLLTVVLTLSMAVTPLTTLWTCWPLRVAFLISRPALERLADRVSAGQAPLFPTRAGLYHIRGAATDPVTGNIALITDANPGGRAGFVRYQPGTPHGPFSSLFMVISLDWTWAFEMED